MKVLGVNGSANANGNTHMALEIVSEVMKEKGIDVEIIDLVNYNIKPFSFASQEKQADDIPMLFEKLLLSKYLQEKMPQSLFFIVFLIISQLDIVHITIPKK